MASEDRAALDEMSKMRTNFAESHYCLFIIAKTAGLHHRHQPRFFKHSDFTNAA